MKGLLQSRSENILDIPEGTTDGLLKEIRIYRSGTLRIKFDLKCDVAGPGHDFPAKGTIYRNGIAVGTEQSEEGGIWTTFSEDISGWSKGDAVQLYVHRGGGYYADVRNFRLYVDNPIVEVVTNP